MIAEHHTHKLGHSHTADTTQLRIICDKGKLFAPSVPRSTQPCIPSGSLNRVPASAGVKAGKSPLPGGRQHCVIPYGK